MLLYLIAALLGLGLLLGGYTLFSLSDKGWRRWATPLLLASVYAGMLACGFSALGIARPVSDVPWLAPILWGVALHEDDYEIRAIKLVEGQGIYLFLVPKDGSDPLLVKLRWDDKKAEQLYARMGQEEVESKGYPMFRIVKPGGDILDPHDPLFYDLRHDEQPPEKTGD